VITLRPLFVVFHKAAPNSRPVLTANLNPVPSSSASSPSMTYGGVKWRPGDKPMAVNFGDFLTLNCSSGPSSPPTVLRYYVNENDLVRKLLMLSPCRLCFTDKFNRSLTVVFVFIIKETYERNNQQQQWNWATTKRYVNSESRVGSETWAESIQCKEDPREVHG